MCERIDTLFGYSDTTTLSSAYPKPRINPATKNSLSIHHLHLLPHWLSFYTLTKWFWRMSRGSDRFMKSVKQFTDFHYKQFTTRHGQQLIDIFEFPIKLVLSPFTLAFDIAGSAPRGFGVPELISKLSYVSVFVSAFSFSIFSRISIEIRSVFIER